MGEREEVAVCVWSSECLAADRLTHIIGFGEIGSCPTLKVLSPHPQSSASRKIKFGFVVVVVCAGSAAGSAAGNAVATKHRSAARVDIEPSANLAKSNLAISRISLSPHRHSLDTHTHTHTATSSLSPTFPTS